MEIDKLNTLRIRIICDFLTNGGGTLKEMLTYVNKKLADNDQFDIQTRTLQHLIEKLRFGDFEHNLRPKTGNAKKIFQVLYTHSDRSYRWSAESNKPVFGDLEEDERLTLPFLKGILERYSKIPAVQKILINLPEIFGITEKEMQSSKAIFHTGPEIVNPSKPSEDFSSGVINLCVKLLGHIQRKEPIEFHYLKVDSPDIELQEWKIYVVRPLQIRHYQDLFYLTAEDSKGRITNFRIDQIARLRVDLHENEEFPFKVMHKSSDLKKHFEHSLGIWSHGPTDPLYEIHIRFSGWASSYIRRLRFHPSQTVISTDVKTKSVVVSFRIKLIEKILIETQNVLEASPELDFFLGRFRNNAKIIDAKPV